MRVLHHAIALLLEAQVTELERRLDISLLKALKAVQCNSPPLEEIEPCDVWPFALERSVVRAAAARRINFLGAGCGGPWTAQYIGVGAALKALSARNT